MDKRFESIDEILDFAIANEIEANQFYLELAAKMDVPVMKQVFEEFAREEEGHRAKLEAVKRGSWQLDGMKERIQTMGLADYLVDPGAPGADMSYADALVLAMKKEKAAYKLYIDLADRAEADDIRNLFLSLAAEEAKHKLRFEIEYDDVVLKED
jgi:rubrerythrin